MVEEVFSEISDGADYPVSDYDLVVREASEIPYTLLFSPDCKLRFLKAVKLVVDRLSIGGIKFERGVYTTAEINEKVGFTVAVNSLAASDENCGSIEVLKNPRGFSIIVR